MHIARVIGRSLVAFTIAVAPLASVTLGVTDVAFAKGGNGNGGNGMVATVVVRWRNGNGRAATATAMVTAERRPRRRREFQPRKVG